MEMQCNGNRGVIPSLTLGHNPGTATLKNFVIPRKKKASGKAALEPCAKESRDYALIESTLHDLMLDVGQQPCKWGDAKLVDNEELLREFAEKRSDMRSKGRHLRETEERFCFLVASDQETTEIYQQGLKVAKANQHCLGKPSHGVYLFKHVDVALKCPDYQPAAGKNMIVFKVLFGRVKKVTPSSVESGTQDPTISFDCHMSRDSVSPRDSLSLQILGSSVFLFDFNEKHELNTRPRQCLPYAVIPIVSMNLCPFVGIPASPTELPTKPVAKPGPLESLKAFVLAERRGKGESAMVTFKHYGTHGSHVTDQKPREAGVERNVDCQNIPPPFLFMPQQQLLNFYPYGPWAGYTPVHPVQDSIQCGSTEVNHSTFSIQQSQISAPKVQTQSDSFKEGEARISTIVYSSKTVKDPRLSARESGDPNRAASVMQQKLGTVPEGSMVNAQNDLPISQPQVNESTGTTACIETMPRKTQQVSESWDLSVVHKSEKLPSLKLFKMKFQKYQLYFRMTDAERMQHIWSRTDLSLDQKNLLLDRIHFYEHYYEKYKRGSLFPEVTKTDQSLPMERTSEGNVNPAKTNITSKHTSDKSVKSMCLQLKKVEQPELNSTRVQGQLKNKQSRWDIAPSDVASKPTKHVRPEPTALHLNEQEQNALSNGHLINEEKTVGGLTPSTQQPLSSLLTVSQVCPESSAQMQTQTKVVREIRQDLPPAAIEESQISQLAIETNGTEHLVEKEGKEVSFGDVERKENTAFVDEGHLLDVGVCEEVYSMTESETAPLRSSPRRGKEIDPKIHHANEGWREQETLKNFKNSEKSDNGCRPKTNSSEVFDNTIYNFLYKRLQLTELLSNSAPTYEKSYLIPQHPDPTSASVRNNTGNCDEVQAVSDQTDMNVSPVRKNNREESTMLGITIKGDARDLNATRKPLTLSERFSRLACYRGEQPLSSLLEDSMLTDRNKWCDTAPMLTKNEYISSFNIKLVRLLTQKYNECQLRTSHGSAKLRKVSDFKSTIYRTALRSGRPHSKSTFKKACCLKRQYFQTLPRAVRRTQLYRAVIQNTKDIVLHEEPSCITETSNEAKLHQSVNAPKQSADGLEQSYRSKVTSSDDSAVEKPDMCNLPENVSSTASKQPLHQSLKCVDQKSDSNYSADRSHLEATPSVTSKDSNEHFQMEGTRNQDKHEVQQKVQEVTSECMSEKNTKCQYSDTSAGKDIPTKDRLSQNINTCSGIQKNDVSENTIDHSTANSKVKTTPQIKIALNKNAQEPTVDSNMENNHNPAVNEQKITSGSDAQEVKLISKLRNYLTKFESTVKLQEPLDEIIPEPLHQGVDTPSKYDTAQKSQLLKNQNTEALNPDCVAIVSEQNVDITNPGSIGSSLTSNSVTSTSQQNILGVNVSGSAMTMRCAPNCVTTQSLVTSDPKPDSTTSLDTVLEGNNQYPLIELSRPKLPPEPQHTQTKTSDGDQHMQSNSNSNSSNKTNGQCFNVNKPHSRQNSQDHQVTVEPQEAAQGEKPYAKTLNTIAFQRHYNTEDISDVLKEADCMGIDDLHSLVSKAKDMLKYFISNFERDQGAPVQSGIVTRDIILEKYLHQPPAPFDLKYEALNSFLELQMMVEAREFIENKISYLSAKQTFRSLLWYDPSLYGELFKGRVGLQHQSCVYTSFQQGLKMEGYSKLQNYYIAVTTLNQQLMMVPQTSYYLYLKSKREKLEIEAALQNMPNCDSFFLSVPVSSMINFGNSLEHLEKLQNCVIAFVETPAANIPGAFDVGKAEHLSIICRFIQEKMHFAKTCKAPNSQVAWFGLEHLLYDASKILVAKDMARGMSQSNPSTFQGMNSNHVYGAPNPWCPMFSIPPQMPQIHGGMRQPVDMNRSLLQRSTSDRRHYIKKRKSIDAVDTSPLGVKRRHSYPVMGQNNALAHNIQPQMNPINPSQFQPALHSNNLLKQHTALLKRRTQDNTPPPQATAATPGRQSHSHIRALLLAKQQQTAPHQQPSPSGPLPSSSAGLPAVQTSVPPPSITMGTPKYLPSAFQPSYEGVIRRVPEHNTPQHAVASKQSKNPFTLGPVPSLQIPPSLCAPRPPGLHSSTQFASGHDKASALPEPTPLNYPFFVLNGCTYTSSNSSVANKADPNDKS